MTQNDLLLALRKVLNAAPAFLSHIKSGGEVVREGIGFGDVHSDIEIRADRELGNYFFKKLKDLEVFSEITIEGEDPVSTGVESSLRVFIDPLDNSLGYKKRIGEVDGLPYTAVMTVLDGDRFADVLYAGVISLRTELLVESRRVASGTWVTELRHPDLFHKVSVMTNKDGSPLEEYRPAEHMLVIEPYYPRGRQLIYEGFVGEKVYLVAPKSAAYEMMMVALGRFIAFVSTNQKSHELGAGFALVRGAGGIVQHLDTGEPLDEHVYQFNEQIPVILAANEHIAFQLRKRFGLVVDDE